MRSEIRPAAERDLPELTALWASCFPDPEEYIRFFYRENFSRISVPVLTVDEKPVSMIHLMDAAFADGENEFPVRFVYAVGTLPAYRGNGFARALLLSAVRAAKEGGYGLFLKPVPSLKAYYSALGFAEDSRFRVFTAKPEPGESTPLSFSPLSARGYNRLRERAFSGRPFVKWPDAHVKWCVDENAFCGGQTLALSFKGAPRFLMGYPVGGVLRISETDLSPEELRLSARPLCDRFGVSRLEAYLPEEAFPDGPAVPSSFVCNAPLRRTYANLLLF